jgi:hypothetical protein
MADQAPPKTDATASDGAASNATGTDPAAAPATADAPDASSSASDTNADSGMASKMTNMLKANATYIIVGLVCVAAGAFLIAYILYWLINRALIAKKGITVGQTKIPIVGTQLTKITSVASPVSTNGKRFSMCFWIYVHDIDKYRGSNRHVMHLGDDEMETSSPAVFFGPSDNKLYIYFKPIKNDTKMTTLADKPSQLHAYMATKYGISIDYIPIQRWVHVCVVVNEEASGGTITTYVDGELVKVMTSGNKNTFGNSYSDIATIQNLNLNRAGSLIIGGSTSDTIGPGFSGLVSRVRLFNYDLNINDVYYEYRSGPIDNLLAKLGLPAYGLRTPVYKL